MSALSKSEMARGQARMAVEVEAAIDPQVGIVGL
mgnify:CR=1 FL=1